MSVATTAMIPTARTSSPRTRKPAPAVVQVMPLSMALELLSGEAMYFCRRCEQSAFRCTHDNIAESVYGVQCRVGDFLHLKRAAAKYTSLVNSLAQHGQQAPLELCAHGRSLLNGHHRLAAMAELLIPFVAWTIGDEECSCDLG